MTSYSISNMSSDSASWVTLKLHSGLVIVSKMLAMRTTSSSPGFALPTHVGGTRLEEVWEIRAD
jgi:hypothetical protein